MAAWSVDWSAVLVVTFAVLVVIAAAACWALSLIGLPGNWLVVALAAIFAYFVPSSYRADIGIPALVGLIGLAALGEVLEFFAGVLGASQAGSSKRGAALALVGSLVGGVVGLFVALPIPVVGPVAGALVFASLGALGGAVLGEQWKGRDLDSSLRVGQAAFWGRLLGTLGKVWIGCLMLVLLIAALLVQGSP